MRFNRRLFVYGGGLLTAVAITLASPPIFEASDMEPASSGEEKAAGMDIAPLRESFDPASVLRTDIAVAEKNSFSIASEEFEVSDLSYAEMPAKELKAIGRAEKSEDVLALEAPRRVPGKIVTGYMIGKDFVHGGSEVNCVMEAVADETDPTMIHIHNFYGLEETVDAVIDEAAGTVSILPQLIWKSTSYGNVYMFPITYEGGNIKFFPSSPVTGTIDADGVIRLGAWGAIVGDGANAGMLLAAIDNSEYCPANATMTATKRANNEDTAIAYPLLVEQPSPAEMTIYNFGTTGVPVKARVAADGRVTVSPQFIANMGLYGAFNCFPINLSTMAISKTDPIIGQVSGKKVTFQPWVAGSVMQDGLVALFLTTCELTAEKDIEMPASHSFDLEGQGTVKSPWLIKSADDLLALSQASKTNSFSGKYFRQTADIDMKAVKGFEPIGVSTSAFDGNYDGGGFTISNLHIDGVGYHFQGLFGALYTNSSVADVHLVSSSISGSGYYLGILAGYSQGRLENCTVNGTATTTGLCVGGVIGRSYGVVTECSFSGHVEGCGYVGGIVGYSYGEISECHSDADVSLPVRITDGASCVGGIAGLAQSYSTAREGRIYDCRFSGTVTQGAGYGFAGGIAGYMYAVDVNRCLNTGTVSSTSSAAGDQELTGGIAGIIRDLTMKNCLNTGTVSVAGPSQSVGGLIGYITCTYTGGFGLTEFVHVSECYNSGQVIGSAINDHAGVFGSEYTLENFEEKPSDTAFTNVWSDNQATGLADNVYGKTTGFFVNAIPAGFSSREWSVNSGLYTTLKSFEGTSDDKVASAVIRFADGESTRVMKNSTRLDAPSEVRWYILSDGRLTEISNSLQLLGKTLHLRGLYGNDEIVATVDGNLTGRRYTINVVPKVFDGEGTADNPYLIKDVDDFKQLHDAVMHYDHLGDFFLQTADVDFSGTDGFSGVAAGNHVKRFAGTFDGGNKRIEGLKINAYKTDGSGTLLQGTYNYGGLFHIGSATSTIRNVVIGESCQLSFYGQAGAVVGYTEGAVENCRNYAAISGQSHIGGIVGYVTENASVKDCYNSGDITAAGDYTGGVVGYNLGSVASSQNDADIKSTGKFVGGVTGASAGSVALCVNSGKVEGADYTGGVIGSSSNGYGKGDVTDCFSSGMVVCDTEYRGGVVGYANGRGTVEGNFFDSSVNNMDGCSSLSQGFTGLSTSEFLVAKAPEGFNAEAYQFSTDAYPTLAAFKDEMAGVARRAIFVRFEKGEKQGNVLRATALSADSKIEWSLAGSDYFSLADGSLCIVTPETEVASDVLTATYDGKYTKEYNLKSIPLILDGRGSASEPFLIRKPEDLNLLADFMGSSKMDYEGYYFRVENNIEYTDEVPFEPIARTGVQFQGDFDGNSKTISGIAFNDETTKTGKNIGFFGTVGRKGHVHDLTLEGSIQANSYAGSFAGLLYGKISNSVAKCTVNAKGSQAYAGGFAGRMYDGSVIDNSEFSGVIMDLYATNISYMGGFAGQLDAGGTISNSVNKGTIGNVKATSATAFTGSQYVGGFVGWHQGVVTDCVNEGKVQGRMYVAGIVGRLGKTGEIYNSSNTSDISVTSGGYVGGIAPVTQGSGPSKIINCFNTGAIHGKSYVAGIIGQITNGCTIDKCYNTGRISGFSSTAYGVGGVIGQMAESTAWPTTVTNSWNEGEVYNETQSTGGFVGKGNGGHIYDCYNTGNVTVNKETEDLNSSGVGGFAGSYCASAERIWNSGNVVSNVPCAAGIIGTGAMPVTVIKQAVNYGNVTLSRVIVEKAFGAGGIWGGYGPSELEECYNYGTITAPDLVAGINGAMWTNSRGGSSIKNCYNAGKVVATDEAPVAVSNIATVSTAATENTDIISVSNAYFDKDVCETFADDKFAQGLTRAQLMKADLGDSFTYRQACLPTLPFMDEVPMACFHAAHYELDGEDTLDNINAPFHIGLMPHVVWTSSDNIEISEEGVVSAIDKGEGWIKATTDEEDSDLAKTFNLNLKYSGVEGISGETAEVKSVEYYTIDGLRIAEAPETGFYIVKITYVDGTCKVLKTR